MKKIGIIGGMSYESSLHYYDRINRQVNESAGGLICAELIIYNVNFENIRKLMLNNEWDKIGLELVRIAKILEQAGADYIVIATNTMHKLADYVQSNINIPLIHIADCVAEKCLNENITTVGLLGTRYSMEEDFLKDRLGQNGLKVSIPQDTQEIEKIDQIIFDELCKGIIKEESKKYYLEVIDRMKKRDDIQGVILGCTEIEMLIKKDDLNIPIFDTTQSHIDTIVKKVLTK